MITFPATDIEYALQAEIDSLRSQLAAYKTKGLDTAVRRARLEELEAEVERLKAQLEASEYWFRKAQKEIERLKVIEAAHHRVVDALWGGEYWAAVGKERGNNLDAYGQVVGGTGKITF
jgi:predicted RNase H-like nuclease (RuvC/YqgF family)